MKLTELEARSAGLRAELETVTGELAAKRAALSKASGLFSHDPKQAKELAGEIVMLEARRLAVEQAAAAAESDIAGRKAAMNSKEYKALAKRVEAFGPLAETTAREARAALDALLQRIAPIIDEGAELVRAGGRFSELETRSAGPDNRDYVFLCGVYREVKNHLLAVDSAARMRATARRGPSAGELADQERRAELARKSDRYQSPRGG